MNLKCLTLKEPYATLLMGMVIDPATGLAVIKDVENRDWFPKVRLYSFGVHAGKANWRKTADEYGLDEDIYAILEHHEAAERVAGRPWPHYGCVLGSVSLRGVLSLQGAERIQHDATDRRQEVAQAIAASRWSFGKYCWLTGNPKPLPEPVPMKGMLGLWNCPWPPPDGVM